ALVPPEPDPRALVAHRAREQVARHAQRARLAAGGAGRHRAALARVASQGADARRTAHMSATLMERPTPSRPSRPVTPPDAPRQRWCVVTCEYPPIDGGVSDHTHGLVATLAAQGDVVDVWCPPVPATDDAE